MDIALHLSAEMSAAILITAATWILIKVKQIPSSANYPRVKCRYAKFPEIYKLKHPGSPELSIIGDLSYSFTFSQLRGVSSESRLRKVESL